MSSATHVSDLTEREREKLRRTGELGERICRRYFANVPDAIDSATLQEALHAWQRDPSPQKPTANQVATGMGVLFGLALRRRFALQWRVVSDAFGTDLCLYCAVPDKEHAEIIISPLQIVAKRMDETEPWVEETYRSLCDQLQDWQVPDADAASAP
jgi:hypothetical protein